MINSVRAEPVEALGVIDSVVRKQAPRQAQGKRCD
jgi:hypothetical protein